MEDNFVKILIPVLSLILAGATFFIGRLTASKSDGEKSGAMASDLGYIKAGVDDLKKELRDLRDGLSALNSRMAVAEQEIKTLWKMINKVENDGK
jgi:chromosome segregation ATPase